jgi:hypothetical protein
VPYNYCGDISLCANLLLLNGVGMLSGADVLDRSARKVEQLLDQQSTNDLQLNDIL